ncbi:MAG: glycosyltransferase family A protein [bacterium]
MIKDISVILNVYKRPETLEKQIQVIKNQSIKIKSENIHVWYNKSDLAQYAPKDKYIKTYYSNWNTKFFGRFLIPSLIRTEYVAIFDDDLLPQPDWFKNCLDSMEKQEGIYGGSGVLVKTKEAYHPHIKFGWNGQHSNNIERVDLVGHAWFFKQEWIKYMWMEKPVSWDNGEDIMFSYLCQKYGGINTFVPPHPESNKNLWCTEYQHAMKVGSDENSSWKIGNHLSLRGQVVKECVKNGWKLTIMNR